MEALIGGWARCSSQGRGAPPDSSGVGGDWPVTPDGAGVSLAKGDRDTGSASPDRWAASEQLGGTPGRENFPPPTESPLPITFNELSDPANPNFWVELYNRDTNATALAGWVVRWDGVTNVDDVIPPGVVSAAGDRLVLDEASLGFRPSPGDRLFLFTPNRAHVADGVVCERRPCARSPEGGDHHPGSASHRERHRLHPQLLMDAGRRSALAGTVPRQRHGSEAPLLWLVAFSAQIGGELGATESSPEFAEHHVCGGPELLQAGGGLAPGRQVVVGRVIHGRQRGQQHQQQQCREACDHPDGPFQRTFHPLRQPTDRLKEPPQSHPGG